MPEVMRETGPQICRNPNTPPWSSRPRSARSACGSSWRRRCCSSAACCSPTRSIAACFPEGFAEAGRHTKIVIGTVNTVILLTSSFVVAWAVHLAERGRGRGVAVLLGVAALFGIAFLGLKGLEYYQEWDEGLVPGLRFEEQGPHAKAMELFYFLYFMLTGVHGLHVTIGVGLLGTMAVRAWRGAFPAPITLRSRFPGCTGTSSISSGSSCIR